MLPKAGGDLLGVAAWLVLPPPELWTGGSVGVDELVVGVSVAVTVGWLTVVGVWDTLVAYVGV